MTHWCHQGRRSCTLLASACALAGLLACSISSQPAEAPGTNLAAEPIEGTEPQSITPQTAGPVPSNTRNDETAPAKSENPAELPLAPSGPTLRVTEFTAELRKLGLDPLALPPLEQMTSIQRYKLMPLFEQSLGKHCEDCHAGEDYEKETPAKEVSRQMWEEMTRPFRLPEGPVFCDSCHQGSAKNLERELNVKAYMKAEYVDRLLSAQGTTSCSTCHGEEFEPNLFESVWGP